jgi:hypothetical protein
MKSMHTQRAASTYIKPCTLRLPDLQSHHPPPSCQISQAR